MRPVISEKPAENDARCGRRSRSLAVVAIGLGICVTAAIAASRSPFEELLAEFELAVSPVTSFALSSMFPLVLGLIVAATAAKEFIPQSGAVANIWNGAVICLALASLVFYAVAVFASLMALIGSLS